MGATQYLVMTLPEIRAASSLPERVAYLGLHFSPSADNLAGFPERLPGGSLLLLDDRVPPTRHTPEKILPRLQELVESTGCAGVYLDFQQPDHPETGAFAQRIAEALPVTVGVSCLYARALSCPVVLPPFPLDRSPREVPAPWAGREIWAEQGPDALLMTLDAAGCHSSPAVPGDPAGSFFSPALTCRYRIRTFPDHGEFLLWRDGTTLPRQAEILGELGITRILTPYREVFPGKQVGSTPPKAGSTAVSGSHRSSFVL